jgi:hypothetical protein
LHTNWNITSFLAEEPPSAIGPPQVAATNTSVNNTANTNHTVNLPSGIQSGNLLIVIFGFDGGTNQTITWPIGWTSFFRSDRSTVVGVAAAYRQADGSEGSTITVQTSANTRSSHNSYRITGAADPATRPPESAASNGNSTTPNPPSLTPTGGAKNYLWIALETNNDGTITITAYPANYSGGIQANGDLNASTTGSAARQLNAASEDPGTFTITGTGIAWAAGTLVVHPAVPSVDITVRVHHTNTSGGDPQLITSASTTITSATADPLVLALGSDLVGQTFTSADPRLLRMQIEVTGVANGGSFVLDYDGTCATNKCSNLNTPVVVVPEGAVALAAVGILIPLVTAGAWRRRRLAQRARQASSPFAQGRASRNKGSMAPAGRETPLRRDDAHSRPRT